ncbi:MAG: phytase [Gammaproteobacteria bacterium]|nr:phytase [Gammaproteobacteria bacterium]
MRARGQGRGRGRISTVCCCALLFAGCGALLLAACGGGAPVREDARIVHPLLETTPVPSGDDAADDPAIWLHPTEPAASLILGTDKRSGLAVYDLSGNQTQFLERGRLNNVDLRGGIALDGGMATLAVATNRSSGSMDVFRISSEGLVSFTLEVPLNLAEPYGICMGVDDSGGAHAFVNSTDAEYQHWRLNPGSRLQPRLEGAWNLDSQPEGCAVDDAAWTLYLGEEEHGIWLMPADAARAGEIRLLDAIASGRLAADVEGMDVYRGPAGEHYLIVSSQGDHSFAVYDLARNNGNNGNNGYAGSFTLAAGGQSGQGVQSGVDGVKETDGLAVTAAALNDSFPRGLLVVQDGINESPAANQNFKLVSWADVEQALGLPRP